METCKHEFDPDTIQFSEQYGRIGICKHCGKKIYHVRLINKPKRTRIKMKKKQRRKLHKEIKNGNN